MQLQCSSYCTGESYNLLAISEYCSSLNCAHRIYGRDVLHIDSESLDFHQKGDLFIYQYGCVVFWGFTEITNEEKILNTISKFLTKPLVNPILDRCHYVLSSDNYIDNESDEIHLQDSDPYIKLSLSYGLSQSVKLSFFEESVEKT